MLRDHILPRLPVESLKMLRLVSTQLYCLLPLADFKLIRTDADIKEAVMQWCWHAKQGTVAISENKYGHISLWDVSRVANMSGLFCEEHYFNNDISEWNVSNVTNMRSMFFGAKSFNRDLSNWNVGNVKDMLQMFRDANSFNQDLANWEVGNVTNMMNMFTGANSLVKMPSWYPDGGIHN